MSKDDTGVIIIREDGKSQTVFPAPRDSRPARSLWVFLVENLRPGLEVELIHSNQRLVRDSGKKLSIELYRRVMDGSGREEV